MDPRENQLVFAETQLVILGLEDMDQLIQAWKRHGRLEHGATKWGKCQNHLELKKRSIFTYNTRSTNFLLLKH